MTYTKRIFIKDVNVGVNIHFDEDTEWMEKWKEEDRQKVVDFLANRLGYLYIEYNLFDEAREYFTKFLNSPTSEEYAREGLEYLDSIQR